MGIHFGKKSNNAKGMVKYERFPQKIGPLVWCHAVIPVIGKQFIISLAIIVNHSFLTMKLHQHRLQTGLYSPVNIQMQVIKIHTFILLLMEQKPAPPGIFINLANNGLNYQPQLVNAGFLPSTVWFIFLYGSFGK